MAHALDFIPQMAEKRPASRSFMARFRQVFGLSVCDMPWDQALNHVHSLIGREGGRTVISFLTSRKLKFLSADAAYAAALQGHLLLPEGEGIALAARMLTGERFAADLDARDFIPALMTHVAEPMRIGLVGEAGPALDAAIARLRAHVPWHSYIGLTPESLDADLPAERTGGARFDVLIVALGTPKQEIWVEQHIGARQASLVIHSETIVDFLSGQGACKESPRLSRILNLPSVVAKVARERLRGIRMH